jgi:hypothetical protein
MRSGFSLEHTYLRAGDSAAQGAVVSKNAFALPTVGRQSLFGTYESGGANMSESRLYPSVADEAPAESTFTSYDEQHLLVYADLLETEADGGD